MTRTFAGVLLGALLLGGSASAANLTVTIEGSERGHFPKGSVHCVADGHGKYAQTGGNQSPALRWTAGPAGTKSYAILMTDPDVPADFSTVNKDGVTVPADAPRQLLYHWVLIGIPASRTQLAAGEGNQHAQTYGTPKGDAHGEGLLFYQGGYGGPCPPWNDMRPHHYRIQVFALDDGFALNQPFTGKEFEAAISGHVLAQGEASGAYATNAGAVHGE